MFQDLKFLWDLQDGDLARVAGWGRTVRSPLNAGSRLIRNKAGSKQLQVVPARIAFEECLNGVSEEGNKIPYAFNKTGQICAGGERGIFPMQKFLRTML